MLFTPPDSYFRNLSYSYGYNFGDKFASWLYARGADALIVISDALKDYYKSFVPTSKILRIYNGIDISIYKKEKIYRDFNMPEIFQISVVGLMHPQKHPDIVILGIRNLLNRGYKVHLNFFGGAQNSTYLKYLMELVKNEKMENHVTFYGYLDNINEYLLSSHIGVLASEFEAFGRVTIEYMATGVIPVVTNSGANLEIVKDNQTGFVFNLNDATNLSIKLGYVLDNYTSLHEMIEYNYQEVKNKYSSWVNFNAIMSVYDSVLIKYVNK